MELPTLGSRLRELRELRGMSITDLCRKTGLSKGSISMMERNLTSPTCDNMAKICIALHASADYLIFGYVPVNHLLDGIFYPPPRQDKP